MIIHTLKLIILFNADDVVNGCGNKRACFDNPFLGQAMYLGQACLG